MTNKKPIVRLWAFTLILSLLLIFLSGCGNKRVTAQTDETVFGIDVARYQGTVDWETVSQSGIGFAMVRVGYRGMSDGEITEDSNGRYNLQEAAKYGIKLGAYFFSTAVTEEEAREEAAWVADLIAGYPITYPVVYDCENFNDPDSRQYGMTKSERTEVALAFLETIKKLGYEPMFYASKGDMEGNKYWETDRIEEDYKIWVAQYPAEPYPQTPETSYAGIYHMWQYSMEGQVDGIKGPVDLNIAYFGYNGIEPAKSKEKPEEVEADIEATMDFDEVNEKVTAKNETNLRNIPSQDTDSIIMRTLKNGEVAQRIAISRSGWSKLMLEGNVYYAVSSYLTTELTYGYDTEIVISGEVSADDIQTKFHETNQTVTAKDVVNLRSLPSVDHKEVKVIAQLKHGDTATCVGTSDNGWSKLIYRGTTCYAITSYLEQTNEQAVKPSMQTYDVDMDFSVRNETVTAIDKVNLRDRPNTDEKASDVIVQLQKGDIVVRVGVSDNGWSKLSYNGITCYAVSRYLTVVDTKTVQSEIQTRFTPVNDRVTAKKEVNLRSLPSVEDPNCIVIAMLKNGEYIRRTGINEEYGWSRVEYNGQTLYCISSYLQEE